MYANRSAIRLFCNIVPISLHIRSISAQFETTINENKLNMYKKKKKAIDKFSASLSAYNKTKLLKLIYHDL